MIKPAPFRLREAVGSKSDYYIHKGYAINLEPQAFDDTPFTDEFQKPIYEYARQVADGERFKNICDVGCGSGFKLMTNFFDRETIGLELEPTVTFLRKKWPGRNWLTPEAFKGISTPIDTHLVICADVIEHVEKPDELLAFIAAIEPYRIVLSTPERDQLNLGTHDGPPRNPHHIREWNFSEFHAFVGDRFQILQHFVIEQSQCVECVLL